MQTQGKKERGVDDFFLGARCQRFPVKMHLSVAVETNGDNIATLTQDGVAQSLSPLSIAR